MSKKWIILTCTYTKTLGNRINVAVFEHWSTLILISPFSMGISTHFLKTSSETWTWGLDDEGTRRAQSLSHAFVDVRRMKPPRGQWSPATVSSWKIGKSPEPWRHWYPTSHSPATDLTQVDILQNYRDWHGFVSKIGHHSSLSGWKWWNIEEFLHLIGPCPSHCYIAMENIYKTSIMMYGRKLLRANPHFTHFHWFSPFIAIHRRIVQCFKQLIARIAHRGVSSAASTATWVMAMAGKSPNWMEVRWENHRTGRFSNHVLCQFRFKSCQDTGW